MKVLKNKGVNMNSQDVDNEYKKFLIKWADKVKEFVKDFNNLSGENKRKFQKYISVMFPGGISEMIKFLNTKF